LVVSTATDQQAAPGALEEVRTLLNTWRIPNDTRVPVDELGEAGEAGDVDEVLRGLRNDLRAVVEGASDADRTLTAWIDRLGVTVVVDGGRVRFRHDAGRPGDLLAIVLDAVADGTWPRLKACPDCRWAFYDNTRNGSKRWCLMAAAGPGSRGCGNIAKVRRHRERARRP
jgi:predicted RNA-binding Zn ribbon-like protein